MTEARTLWLKELSGWPPLAVDPHRQAAKVSKPAHDSTALEITRPTAGDEVRRPERHEFERA